MIMKTKTYREVKLVRVNCGQTRQRSSYISYFKVRLEKHFRGDSPPPPDADFLSLSLPPSDTAEKKLPLVT